MGSAPTPKIGRKEAAAKDKPTTIYMVRSWQRTIKQKITQSFEQGKEITFPPLTTNNGTEGPLVIEAEISRHTIHRMYIDGGSSMEILYEHCFNRLRPEIKSQMVPATTSLTGFSGETTWPLGQLRLLVTIGDITHSTKAWMNFMIVKSLSPYKEHRLNIREGCPPVRQKKRGQDPKHTKAIQAEDCYPLLEIDWKVESLCGYPFKCFLDAYKGYHQIQLAAADEEKTAFYTGQGVYCYTKMPFGLKNAGATYQRLMDKAFESQMGRNIEVYVDDLVVKSHIETVMGRDIEETFQTLRKINMKLNPKKCSFGLVEGVFLGYVITPEGIKPCLDKTTAVLQFPSPQTIKEVQSLNGKLASLNCGTSVSAAEAAFIKSPPIGRTQTTGRADHSIMLGQHNITYRLRTSIKGQILADFLNEIPGNASQAQMGVKNVQANVDSKPIANQVLGTCVAKEDNMIKYLEIAKGLVSEFKTFSISQVPRSKEVTAVIEEEGPTWMTKLVNYLKEGILPGDEKEARQLYLKARQYELIEGFLYKRSFLTPWLRCVGPLQAEYVMKEIHKGSCSMHAGPRSVVAKAIRLGYFGPAMHKDAQDMIRRCSDYPFSEGSGKVKFLIVAMDYFTKWIEAKAVATITGGQFADNPFKDWCNKLNITQRFASVKHPQSNGLVERANRSLGEVIPAEIGMPTNRTTAVDVVNNDEELRLNLDLLEERRELAAMSEAKSKSKMMKYYNSRVAGGKLGPKWEGLYEVTDALGNGAYKLRSTNGTMLPRTWNVTNLKRCYL
nr:reverse transcriptase domain-containing protein [Tanacetum cinerariifolium]